MVLPFSLEPKEKYIFNPDTEDFSVEYNAGDGIKTYTLKSLKAQKFPTPIADHIKKHLADKILNKRGVKLNPMADLEAIMREIETND